jgi:hypothetical protein
VARIESIKMLLSIAAYENLAIFKVDIRSAFMRTPMVDDVKHKWMRLDKLVAKILYKNCDQVNMINILWMMVVVLWR